MVFHCAVKYFDSINIYINHVIRLFDDIYPLSVQYNHLMLHVSTYKTIWYGIINNICIKLESVGEGGGGVDDY